MWAATPTTPEVVTLPLTDLSAPNVIVPKPGAAVVTGGTSWAPLKLTWVLLVPDVPAQPAKTSAAAPMAIRRYCRPDSSDAFIHCLRSQRSLLRKSDKLNNQPYLTPPE